ncbi:MAG: site-specific DNA-methyltransferase [Desulfobacteraceae bacterium]|nr:site-specific DNA-methyltransferase [Desulfobacteraceae bacterium]
MTKIYNSSKLNVINKTRSNPLCWRGQFTPELIEYFLDMHAKPNSLICDPFSGSGTVLLESFKKNLDVIGCEVNPAAYAMSKLFEIGTFSFHEKWNMLTETARTIPLSKLQTDRPLYQKEKSSDYRKAYGNFIHFAKQTLDAHNSKHQLVILLNILFKMENLKKLNLGSAWHKAYNEISSFLFSLPETKSQVTSLLCDIRELPDQTDRKIDLIITSPPYINVFNYHQNHRIIMELLDFDILSVAHSEFGSNRKNRGNRFLTVIQYCLDMAQALSSMQRSMDKLGSVIMIVGRESNVRKTAFYNGKIIIDICKKTEMFSVEHSTERCFKNKFGTMIYEDILVLKPLHPLNDTDITARDVALSHLKSSADRSPSESKNDLEKAVASVNTVKASPTFKYRRRAV